MKKTIIYLMTALLVFFTVSCSKDKSIEPVQMTEGSGTNVARIHFSNGKAVDLRLFGDSAPKAADSFIDMIKSGAYEGLPVYNVIKDFYIMMGEEHPDINNHGNISDIFTEEINSDYYPLKGALCLSDEGNGIDTSHFFVVTTGRDFLDDLDELLTYKGVTAQEYYSYAYGTELDESVLNMFKKYGGAPWMYGHCIVFGQIYNGTDVIDEIAAYESSGEDEETKDRITIDYIEFK